MLIVVSVLFLIVGLFLVCVDEEGVGGLCLILFVISLIVIGCCISEVLKEGLIDEKISMYQEENTKIEEDIDSLVKQYMDYESSTFKDIKAESSITLVSLYPKLKADELVKQQVEVYTSNNKKIKELKEEKINIPLYKWWIYFGGVSKKGGAE